MQTPDYNSPTPSAKRAASPKRRLVGGACAVLLAFAFAVLFQANGMNAAQAPDADLVSDSRSIAQVSDNQGVSSSEGADDSAKDGGSPMPAASNGVYDAGESAASSEAGASSTDSVPATVSTMLEGAAYAPGEILVQIDDQLPPDEANAFLSSLDFVSTKQVNAEDVAHGFLKLALADGVTVEAAMERLQGAEPVRGVQPNYRLYPAEGADVSTTLAAVQGVADLMAQSTKTNDPYVADGTLWNLDAIGAYDAWDEARSEGASTIAILDEGFNASHEDLAANVVHTYWAAASGSANPSDVSKLEAHGTHVAGIASAEANNGKGVAGVSYNAQLMLVKIADSYGGMDIDNVAKAIDYIRLYASEHPEANLHVINMSIGGYSSTEPAMSGVLYEAIAKARQAGIVTVCAACNAGPYYVDGASRSVSAPFYSFPSDYDNVVSVIALEKYDQGETGVRRMSSSNYNMNGQRAKDLSAPGNDILSTYTSPLYSTAKKGTSMAAPHVAGVLALMFAANPNLPVDDAESILLSSATDVQYTSGSEVAGEGWDAYTGYGLVNAADAVKLARVSSYLSGSDIGLVGQTFTYQMPAQMLWTRLNWTWKSSDESVATIESATGMLLGNYVSVAAVTTKSPGVATITATCGFYSASKTVAVYAEPVITGARELVVGDVAELSVDAGLEGVWDWSSSDDALLTVTGGSGADSDSCRLEAHGVGSAAVSVVLSANPEIGASWDVELKPVPLTRAKVVVSDSNPYTGQPVAPSIEASYQSSALEAGRDYTVSYLDASGAPIDASAVTRPGSYTLRLVGIGSYDGVVERSFSISDEPSSHLGSGSGGSDTSGGSPGSAAGSGGASAGVGESGGSSPSSAGPGSSADGLTSGSSGSSGASASGAGSSETGGSQSGSGQTSNSAEASGNSDKGSSSAGGSAAGSPGAADGGNASGGSASAGDSNVSGNASNAGSSASTNTSGSSSNSSSANASSSASGPDAGASREQANGGGVVNVVGSGASLAPGASATTGAAGLLGSTVANGSSSKLKAQSPRIKVVKRTAKYSQLKTKTQKLPSPIVVKKAKGKVSFAITAANKKAAKKKVFINSKTGKLTVKRGLARGAYKLKIRVRITGKGAYAPYRKSVKVTLKVI